MRVGLPISLLLHAALLGWALITVASTPPDKALEIPVQVELLTVAELDNMRAGNKDAKPEDKPAAAEKPKPDAKADQPAKKRVADLPPPPDKEEVKEKAKEEPKKKEDVKKPEPKPEVDPIAEAIKKAEQEDKKPKEEPKKQEAKKEKKKPVEKKPVKQEKKKTNEKEFDPNKVAALLNKLPNASSSSSDAPADQPTKTKPKPVVGSSEGTGTQLAASEASLLRSLFDQQVQRCWTPPIGAREGAVIVTLQFRLRQDGSVDGQPAVVGGNNSVIFDAAARAAVYAVLSCAPYNLPSKLYGSWKEIEWVFDPSKALNG